MPVGEFCNREVIIASRNTPVSEVARLMRAHHVGDIVVVEEEGPKPVPVGLLTDRDIVVEIIACALDPSLLTVGDAMSHKLVTAREQDGLWETLQRMRTHGIRRMVVVNEAGGLEGILTADDLLGLLAEEFSLLARVPLRGQEREKHLRD